MGIHHVDCCTGLATLADHSVDVIFADPPYFLGKRESAIPTYTKRQSLIDQGWVDFYADWDAQWKDRADYEQWCDQWIGLARRKLKPKGSLFVCGTYHNIPRIGVVLEHQNWYTNRWIFWYNPAAFPRRQMDQLVASTQIVIWARPSSHRTSVYHADVAQFYGGGKNLRDMWIIPFDSARARRLRQMGIVHPSKKPPALIERCLRLAAPKYDAMIVDPFGGSGTTGEVVARYAHLGWRYELFDTDATYVAQMRRLLEQPAQQTADLDPCADPPHAADADC